ncbi:MAG: hypothetical protein C4538_01280 [Nitrospiraceae bacterium]|nr:MAG: hypothetical protein C4538_01280 [Nitrospiraceae bacterium]
MSFILDALKKLEQKRQRGTVPDIMTIHVPEHKQRHKRPALFYLIAGALILNAVILGLWLFPGKRGKENTASLTSSVNQHNIQDISSSGRKDSEGKKSPPLGITEPTVSNEKSHDNLGTSQKKPSVQPSGNEKQNMQHHIQEAGEKSVQDRSSDIPTLSDSYSTLNEKTNNALREPYSNGTVKKEIAAPLSPTPALKKPENNNAEPPQSIYELSQLPQTVQSEIPAMTILGHIYSDSSSARMVNINGSILREGDIAAKNIRIENITENGIVFNYNGLRFRIRAF